MSQPKPAKTPAPAPAAAPVNAAATAEQMASAMTAEPQPQHRWLHKLVGEWTYEADAPSQPGQPSMKVSGAERVRSIGGIWIVAEGEGDMPGGGPATTLMTLGFDPGKQRFVGTWIGSMMANMWVYDGELDANERELTLNSEGPSMANDGAMARYRDVMTMVSDDERTLNAFMLDSNGTWQPLMTARYRRATAPRA
jgi:hypothetical protein